LKKLIISFVLVFVFCFSFITVSAFDDMPNDWSTKALQSAVDNGLLKGSDNKLYPKNNLTRAEMATILVRALGAVELGDISDFTDVQEKDWFYDEMAISYKMKIFKGDGAGKLTPGTPITRQEAFLVLARAFSLTPVKENGLDVFSDGKDVSSWAKEGVEALVTNGYVSGSNGKLNPLSNITRAEFAQVMFNLIKGYVDSAQDLAKLDSIEGNVIVRAKDLSTLENVTVKGDLIIGDGMSNTLQMENVSAQGRVVIRNSGNLKFDGKASEIVITSDSTKLVLSSSSAVKSVTVKSATSSYEKESATTPSIPVTPPDTPTTPEEDIWTDFH